MPELPHVPAEVVAVFVGVVAGVILAIAIGVYLNAVRVGFPRSGARRLAQHVTFYLLVWVGITGYLATRGVFFDFAALPPRIAYAVLPSLALVAWVLLSRGMSEITDTIPAFWLIGLQTFRLPLELVLHQLAEAGAAPNLMTFEGRNFDIITGITAPLIAYIAMRESETARKIAIWWNVAGLLLLANVVIHGMLAAPTRFQVFKEEPSNTFIAHFPYIWLITLLVPVAALLHLLALRALRERTRSTSRQ